MTETMQFFQDSNINFIGRSKIALTFSVLLIIMGVISLIMHGGPLLSIDFTGGTDLQVKIEPRPTVGEVRDVLESKGFSGVHKCD